MGICLVFLPKPPPAARRSAGRDRIGTPADLRTLFPDASQQLLDRCDPLDSFIERRLCEARAWRDGQSSDGIELVRVLEREPTRLRLCGRIYEISDQLAQAFWLELELDGTDHVSWTLRFDVMGTERQKRHALDLYSDAVC